MRRSELLVGLLLAVSLPASAQNFPKVEASAGYRTSKSKYRVDTILDR
jgi:hypothetical protein